MECIALKKVRSNEPLYWAHTRKLASAHTLAQILELQGLLGTRRVCTVPYTHLREPEPKVNIIVVAGRAEERCSDDQCPAIF